MKKINNMTFLADLKQGLLDWQKITTQTLLIFLPLFGLIIAITTALLLYTDNAEIITFRNAERHTVLMQAMDMEHEISEMASDLSMLTDGIIRKKLWDNEGNYISENLNELAMDFQNVGIHRQLYDKIRLLDETGMEIIRINFNKDLSEVVSPEQLQNKKDRYYFKDTFKLNEGEVFISPFDLNVEHGELEQPIKPMIRFASPIFDQNGKKRGIVLLNYLGSKLLQRFVNHVKISIGNQTALLNADGYYLIGQHAGEEWGFMYEDRKDLSFARTNPDAWNKIKSVEALQFETSRGLFTFRTFYPLHEGQQSSTGAAEPFAPSERSLTGKEYHWKILSFIPTNILYSAQNYRHTSAMWILGILGTTMLFVIWWILASITSGRRLEAERSQLLSDSNVRIREQRCMYGLVESIRTRDKIEQTFRDTVALIPPAWQYPELTCARLRFVDGDEYVSDNFEESKWKQSAEIIVNGTCRGVIEIFYLEECPILDEGPFKRQERELLNSIAHTLSEAIAHVQSKQDRGISEKQLRHAQKMEGIGQMAGGIAHDFNNILSIVLGNLGLLKSQAANDEKTLKWINSANKAALRATDLTKQLLSFSRKQAQEVHPCDINQLIRNMESLITRSVTPEIEVEHLFANDLWLSNINSGDFEDALLNLIINARDATSGGGRITLETCNITLNAYFCTQNPGSVPGDYVLLTVSDTGNGISQEQLEHIFEPFFTTKAKGKGTGLGLAMVFGFTKRSGGYIKVNSKLKIGTTFQLYLPRVTSQAEQLPAKTNNDKSEVLPGGKEVLLLVDDEEELLKLSQITLEQLGYRVLTARNGLVALNLLNNEPAIDLLFSDVVMPGGINGYELSEKALSCRANLKILLTSGYTEKAEIQNSQTQFATNLLSKPYSNTELALRIRDLLDS